MPRAKRKFAIHLVALATLLLVVSPSEAKKKKKKRRVAPSPQQRALAAWPKAKEELVQARRALQLAQGELIRATRDAEKEIDGEQKKLDRSGYVEAVEALNELEEHVEQLVKRSKKKLLEENDVYAEAHSEWVAARKHYDEVSSKKPPNPEEILNALRAISGPSKRMTAIEKSVLHDNQYYQSALEKFSDAEVRVDAEQRALADQLESDQYTPATRERLKTAAANVSRARIVLGEKSTVVARLSKILEPSNTIGVKLKINQK